MIITCADCMWIQCFVCLLSIVVVEFVGWVRCLVCLIWVAFCEEAF